MPCCMLTTYWGFGLSNTMPTRKERRNARPRACGSGLYPVRSMMPSTFARVGAETNGDLFSTRETVFFDTSAIRAMSLIVGRSAPPGMSCGTPEDEACGDSCLRRRTISKSLHLKLLLLCCLEYHRAPACEP